MKVKKQEQDKKREVSDGEMKEQNDYKQVDEEVVDGQS